MSDTDLIDLDDLDVDFFDDPVEDRTPPAPPGSAISPPIYESAERAATTPPTDHVSPGARASGVGGETPSLADPLLNLAADALDDLEKIRIAMENRYRQLTRTEPDADGEVRGFGLPPELPEVRRLGLLVEQLKTLEHDAELELKRRLRASAFGPWVLKTKGVGEKQGARLLAAINDPYWNDLHQRPRTVSELWAFCGYRVISLGDPDRGTGDATQGTFVGVAQRRQRGVKSNWSADAKVRAFLIAESCVKQRTSAYRPVYDEGRAKYASAVHLAPCVRCGPSGSPALVGSPLSLGHQHARALRLVAKAVLRDLWREGRRLHGVTDEDDAGSTREG